MKLALGKDVIFVASGGVKMAAKVTKIWDDLGTVNLVVFADGVWLREATRLEHSVIFDPRGERINSWHNAEEA